MQSITDLLTQIVDDLVNPQISLNDIFLKMQVVAFKLKNQAIKDWVSKELNGYKDDETPDFRNVPALIFGNLIQDLFGSRVLQKRNTRIIINYASEETIKYLSYLQVKFSISEIEHYVTNGQDIHFNVPYSMQVEISKTLSNLWHIEESWRVVPISYFVGILSTIKSKLLDFVMELNETLGEGDISLLGQQQRVNDLFRNAIGSIQGETVNINIGDKNNNLNVGTAHNSSITQNANHSYTKNEIEKIRELAIAIKSDLNKHFDGDYRQVMEAEIQKVETQLSKPSPIKIIVNSALQVMYELMIEAAGSAYSPIILEQIQNILR